MQQKLKNREKLLKEYPGEFKHFKNEKLVYEGIQFCKEWVDHRSWLRDNRIKYDDFDEERKFQTWIKRLKVYDRIDSVKLTRAFEYAVEKKATDKYHKKLIQRGKEKFEERQTKAYEKLTGKKMT